MESRIGALDLNVRVPETQAAPLASAARAFTTRVLDRCDALLEARAPGRLVFMRRLDLELRVWGHALDTPDEVEAVAEEMARALDEDARSPHASAGGGEMAVFEDEAHYRAEYLHAVSRRQAETCWFFAPLLEEGPAPGIIVRREHRVLAEAVLTRLAADGALSEVLSALPFSSVLDLAESLAVERSDVGVRDASHTASAIQRALAAFIERPRHTPREDPPGGDSAPATAAMSHADADFASGAPTDVTEIAETFDTQFGGLFYLLSPALELSLGETLWIACVAEAAVFTRIAEALLGAGALGDPAPRLFGSTHAGTNLTAISAEQHAEVVKALLDAMVTALAREGSGDPVVPHLRVVSAGDRRLLVVTAHGSPFALFAWPADSADMIVDGIAAFLASWPLNAPRPTADPALASLDRAGRIRTAAPENPRPWILEQEDDPFATALLTQAAGSLAFLFAARAGSADVTTSAQFVERYVAAPARVVVAGDEMEIRIPMDRIDLAVRGAGLDRDPGWVPWLETTVRFVFVSAEIQ